MSRSWVDDPEYVGLDRRAATSRRRLVERRVRDAIEDTPSLETVLRRIRVLEGLAEPAARSRLLQMLQAAAMMAEAQGRLDLRDELLAKHAALG